MSLVQLRVPFVDTSAAALRWQLDDLPRDALAERLVRIGASTIELRVLGASHQVIVRNDTSTIGEVVACGAGGDPLRDDVACTIDDRAYRLRVSVRTTSGPRLARTVERLVDATSAHPRAVVAAYPGDRHAVTAIAVDPVEGGIGWRTWHAYPRTGELVVTRSTLVER